MSTRDEYIQSVRAVLAAHTERAASQLSAALALVPQKTKRVTIDICTDQDGEGLLHVRVGLEGPDLVVLNRAIAADAELFGTRLTERGLDPALPLMAGRGGTFSVHDALTDCAASWITSVWSQTDRGGFTLPVVVESHDGYGTTSPLYLDL